MTNVTPVDPVGSPPIAIQRIAAHIEEKYSIFLDLSDEQAKKSNNPRVTRLTRSLAAHAVAVLAEISPEDACKTITDGYDDCGIDAIYHSIQKSMIYVVQSKWNDTGNKGVDEGDILKMCSGFRGLLNGAVASSNERLTTKVARLMPALKDPDTHFTLVIASTAGRPLAALQEKHLDDLLAECDGSGNVGLFHRDTLDQKRLYDSLLRDLSPKSIDLEISLVEWGVIRDPIQAAYGQIELGDILNWSSHGLNLFHKNLRNVVHKSDVRASIFQTLKSAADKFWYFNNGATLLCDSMQKMPLYGDKREKGTFICKGVSVVNGAQTIGAIWEYAKNGGSLDPMSRLLVRLISVENCPSGFAVDVTRATNTQQRIDLKDFVALDPCRGNHQ